MAIKLAIADFDQTMMSWVNDKLTFTAEQSYITKMSSNAEAESIQMFLIEYTNQPVIMENKDQNGDDIVQIMQVPTYVYIPYMTAREVVPNHVFGPYPTANYNFTGALYPNQQQVAAEAMEYLTTQGAVILALYTAFGKTITSAFLASMLYGKTIIIVPFTCLLKSWYKTFMDFTSCRSVLILDGIDSLNQFYQKNGDIPDILICYVGRVELIAVDVKKLYKILIVDEAHCFFTQIRSNLLLSFQPEYIIALSATLNKASGLSKMLYAMCGFCIERRLEKKFVVTPLRTGIIPQTKQNKMGTLDWPALNTHFATLEIRNQYIAALTRHMLAQPWVAMTKDENDMDVEISCPRKILIVVYQKKHADNIGACLGQLGIVYVKFYGNMTTYQDQSVVIMVLAKGGCGYDEINATTDFNGIRFNTLILTCSIKDHGVLEQVIGRVLRNSAPPDIIDCIDTHTTLERHWKSRKAWYDKHNATYNYNS